MTVTKRLCIATVLPLETLWEKIAALRVQQSGNDKSEAFTAPLLKGAEGSLERMLNVASEFYPESTVQLCNVDDGLMNARIETRARNGDEIAARQLTQRVLTQLLSKGYRIAADSRAARAFNGYLAGLKKLYSRYRFWSYVLFKGLLQEAQGTRSSTRLHEDASAVRLSLHELREKDADLFHQLQLAAKYCDQGMMLLNMVEILSLES